MHMRSLVLCAATVTLSITSASATMRIADDRGGQIGRYLEAFTTVRSSSLMEIVCRLARWYSVSSRLNGFAPRTERGSAFTQRGCSTLTEGR